MPMFGLLNGFGRNQKKGSVAGFAAKSMAQKALNWESNLVDAVIGLWGDFIFILTMVWYN
jgi:hypothetical protein